jgi:hypothetical protein
MTYLKYTPTTDELKDRIDPYYWQVWQGLPDFKFEAAKSRGGEDALFYDKEGHWIWVPPESLVEFKKDPQTIFFALMKMNKNNKHRARWVKPANSGLEQAIEKAKTLNAHELQI